MAVGFAAAVLALAWGMIGGHLLEGRLLAAVGRWAPTARRVLPFALVTAVGSASFLGGAILVVDGNPVLAAILLLVHATGVAVLMPAVLLCLPTQSSGIRSLLGDLRTAGIEERPARRWAAVMAPWAVVMLGMFALSVLQLALAWG